MRGPPLGRHKSSITIPGRNYGFDYVPRDLERLRFIARWYCVSPLHLLRREQTLDLWHPLVHGSQGDNTTRERMLRFRLKNIRGRMNLMHQINPHPPLGILPVAAQAIGYYATRMGATMVTPWEDIQPAVWQNYAHAFMAADIGMHLERAGFQVYSEREIGTGRTVTGDIIQHDLASDFRGGQGARAIQKRPDLVIPSQSSLNYIAVEIERDENRPLRVYRDKLQAYQGNPNITKVWYCYREGTNTGHRVLMAAQELFGDTWEKYLRLIPCVERDGFYEMGSANDEDTAIILTAAFEDLTALEGNQ
jgi:hypothetical protein